MIPEWFIITILILTKSGVYIEKRILLKDPKYPIDIEIGDNKYSIKKSGLYEDPFFFYLKYLLNLLRIYRYMIIFSEGSTDPLMPKNPEITPTELYIVNQSRALSKAIDEFVSKGISRRILVLAVIVLAVIIGYILTGGSLT